MRGYYLTGSLYGVAALALQRLKVSRFSELNDPAELLSLATPDILQRKTLEGIKKSYDEVFGLLCFSESWQSPVLWGHYAEKHSGIALGFDLRQGDWKSVQYVDRPLRPSLDPMTGTPLDLEVVADRIQHTKASHWAYEKEVRRLVRLSDMQREGALHYLEFGEGLVLREVILGPRCVLQTEKVTALAGRASGQVTVFRASMARTEFMVVPETHPFM